MAGPASSELVDEEVTIGEMVAVIKELWFRIDAGRDLVELSSMEVARLLVDVGALNNANSALSYIQKVTNARKEWVTWDDFNSLFAAGIFKQAIIMKAK